MNRSGAAMMLAALFAVGCAQVKEITGGERDTIAPRLLASVPAQASVGYQGDRIILQFDERVVLERPGDRVLISPPLEVPPTYKQTGPKEVTIQLNTPLRAEVTYVVSLGEAVKDLTEGNPADVDLFFATGQVLDSARITGTVLNAYTGAAEKDVMVLLYAEADSTFRKGRPLYATRCDPDGRFTFPHLPASPFVVNALRDKNANYRYDLPNEEIAFHDTVVNATTDSVPASLALRLFQELPQRQLLREAGTQADLSLRIVLARRTQELTLRDVARTGGQLTWTNEWSAGRDTVVLWPSDTVSLSEGRFEVSTEAGVLDTIRYRPPLRPRFNLQVTPTLVEQGPRMVIAFTTDRPLLSVDTARMQVLVDSLPLRGYTVRTDGLRTAFIDHAVPSGSAVHLTLLPKAVMGAYSSTNDTTRATLGAGDAQSTGTLRVRLDAGDQSGVPFLLQLLDGQDRIVRTDTLPAGSTQHVWERARPGLYTLRAIADANGNGRWDTGDLSAQRQPELVWSYPDKVNIRAAWDIGLEWTLAPAR
jgi:hypothetical protein